MSNLFKKDLFNVDILVLNDENLKYLKEITTGAIFKTNSNQFREGSLYDPDIFGPIGSTLRNEQFAYINLHAPILHPFLYETLISLSSVYKDVAEGTKYAYFDKETQNLVISSDGKGKTGYTFLLENINKIKFNDNNSDQRRYKIELVKKYLNTKYLIDKWLVLPAGLRDYTENAQGAPSEDEINNLYRKLLSTAGMIKNTNINGDLSVIDPIRLKIQKVTLEIFEYIKTIISGKNKFIEGKFAKRAITHGSRNVITPIPSNIKDLTNENNISTSHTVLGLYQYVKSIAPITMNRILSMFINSILNPNSTSSYLVDPKTMRTTLVEINPKKRDEWLGIEGLTNIMNKLSMQDLIKEEIKIDGYYLMLVYDNGGEIKLYLNTNEIEENVDKKKLRPITYGELFYIAIYDVIDKYPAFFTRYPVAGLGGIYPCKLYVKTTTNGRTVRLIYRGEEKTIKEYPILDQLYIYSLSPSSKQLAALGADFDGDCCSLNVVMTDESVNELNKFMDSPQAHLTPTGEIAYSNDNEPIKLVMMELTE